ncbi:MAG: choloylglycine hydrolase family protein [Verrucomicrobia bacterium]|nr:choloylglycine hydrolase family protein [Verrucomicrobiota bacterium]
MIWLAFLSQAIACTGLLLKSPSNEVVSGRTVEFGVNLDISVAVIPRNVPFVGSVPGGSGLKYTSKYALVGGYCFDEPVVMDGMNEMGLVAAAFYFPGYAQYAAITPSNQSRALSPVEFTHWILTQFATIEEVRAGIKSVFIAPTVVPGWGEAPPPMHYIVYDRSGKSLVIEPIGGSLATYENPLGVFTNSPTFDWHMTNLRNYLNLSPYNADPKEMKGVKLAPFGQGSGMVGLPGDFTPPSRFVRAALFCMAALPTEKLVSQAFHLLNQFDIPLGAVRQKMQKKISYDSTSVTSVKDPKALRYYFRSYDDQRIQFVDLNQFDLDASAIVSVKMGGEEIPLDISSQLR